jgi:hypothetical protein
MGGFDWRRVLPAAQVAEGGPVVTFGPIFYFLVE